MTSLSRNNISSLLVPPIVLSSGARTNVGLNAAYVHGVSGAGIAVRYSASEASPINELYVMIDANGGTLGNITMACDIYNEHASSVTQPGSTLRASASAVSIPGSVDKWIKFTFGTPYTPTVGEILWLVLYNTSASPTVDFPNILTITNFIKNNSGAPFGIAYSSTNGFSTAGTLIVSMPFVIVQGTTSYGRPFTIHSFTNYASNTRKRGFRIIPPVTVSVNAVSLASGSSVGGATAYSSIQIFDDATPPGGSALYTFSLESDTGQNRGDLLGGRKFAPINLMGATPYKVVVNFGTSSQLPGVLLIEDYASYPAIFDNMTDNDMFMSCPSVIDDGASAWTIDKATFPLMALHVMDFPAAFPASRIQLGM